MGVLINVYATKRIVPLPDFPHTLNGRRDRTDPGLAEHLQGFAGFVMRGGEREMTQSLYHVIRHVQRVRHHLSLEVEERDLAGIAPWAWAANAVLLYPDGSVRDPSGTTLVDPQTGQAAGGAVVPYPDDAIERKRRHDAQLEAEKIPVAASLPPVVGVDEVVLQTPRDVALRALALLVVAVRAGSLGLPEPASVDELRQRVPRAFDALSPSEATFMSADAPDPQQVIDHAWRYEALLVLQWALGLVDILPPPTATCDAGQTAGVLVGADRAALLASATLRAPSEIVDALDLHLRWHWATRECTRQGVAIPADLDPGILQERHHALNWLVRFEDAPWDEIETPT